MASFYKICCVIIFGAIVSPPASAYRCHFFQPGDSSTTTCEAGKFGCQEDLRIIQTEYNHRPQPISKTVENGVTTIKQECATELCSGSTRQYEDGIEKIKCCNTDLCNTEEIVSSSNEPIITARIKKMCYAAACNGKKCLDNVINSNAAGVCDMNPAYGCFVKTYFGDQARTNTSCATEPCVAIEEFNNKMTCCYTSRCNTKETGQHINRSIDEAKIRMPLYNSGSSTSLPLNPSLILIGSMSTLICGMQSRLTD